MSIGTSIGLVLGLLIFNNIGLGLPIGIGIGVAIGAGLDADAKKKGLTF
ncbi:glycine zipper family protein [Bacillus sp. YZJH907-2]|uniref:Glycine zipper family protein n=2 Tax=Halalkalibacter suaedae TaxID=2822140 RepID=A0A940WZP7_9BACI|nr:glycine zipper family protein [Bacillus suaedae]